ncbi:MAG: ABC transporter ATP-binding protein [Clostridiales bacterium]|nr:ABC transporter ATP-binding protein [Clostridiales bacterium]
MNTKTLWKDIISFGKLISSGNKSVLPTLFAGGFAKAALPFLRLYFTARILTLLIAGDYQTCIPTVALFLSLSLAAGLVEQFCNKTISVLRESCKENVKQQMAEKAFTLEYEEFEKQETMDAIRRANLSAMGSGDIGDQVDTLYKLFHDFFSILFSLYFVVLLLFQVDSVNRNFFTSNISTLALLAIYSGILFCFVKILHKVDAIGIKMSMENDRGNSLANYIFDLCNNEKNAKDIRIYQFQEFFLEKDLTLSRHVIQVFMRSLKEQGTLFGINDFLAQISAGLSYLFVGAKAYYGLIPIGDVLLYAGSINQAFSSLQTFFKDLGTFRYMATYLGTYDEFIRRPSMSYDGTLPIEKRDDARYEFEFHNVSFSYPETDIPVLKNISLRFEIGKTMAIVGQNGAGKTTLIKLLCRLYEPTEGYITLNGIDIRKYNYQEYTRAFSVVFQDFHLFSLPLDENIASGASPDREKLWSVLETVDLKKRVATMKDGLRTRLYNNNGEGVDVSGGEAQRLAIARALYKDAPFVILDEPTAALDPIAEAEIYENFNQLIQNKTAIYISHRMSSCKFCDTILVLDHGKIAEQGTHPQLIDANGIYAKLYEAQAKYYTA